MKLEININISQKLRWKKIRKSGYTKPTLSLEEAVKDYILNYLEKN
jgi:ADP-L-glycero-D-manno-heptose 6-epimerase